MAFNNIQAHFHFLITNSELEYLDSTENAVDDAATYFQEALNDRHLYSPSWEAVGVICSSDYRPDKNALTTYIPQELMYEFKEEIYDIIEDHLGEELPSSVKHTFVDLPADAFPEVNSYITFSREEESGRWISGNVPVERAVFASQDNPFPIDRRGWTIHKEEDGGLYGEMPIESDLFLYAAPDNQIRSAQRSGTLEGPVKASSVFWGPFPVNECQTLALLFRTAQKPLKASPDEGVRWEKDVEIEPVETVNLSDAKRVKNLCPLPEPGEFPQCNFETSMSVKYTRSKSSQRGDPCEVVREIEEKWFPDMIKKDLKKKIWRGKKLENEEASMIYDERDVHLSGRLFSTIVLTSHAQYRMEIRNVQSDDVKEAIKEFRSKFKRLKSKVERRGERSLSDEEHAYIEKMADLKHGESVEYEADNGVTVHFSLHGRSVEKIRLVTTYWTGVEDPPPPDPGECLKKQAKRVAQKYFDRMFDLGDNLQIVDQEDPWEEWQKEEIENEDEETSDLPSEEVFRNQDFGSNGFYFRKIRN